MNVKDRNGKILNLKKLVKKVTANYMNIKEREVERSSWWSRIGVCNWFDTHLKALVQAVSEEMGWNKIALRINI